MRFLCIALLCLLPCAQAEIVLTGVLSLNGQTKATFKNGPEGGVSEWLEAGADYAGYRIVKIDADASSAVLTKDGKETVVSLAKAQTLNGPAPTIVSAPEPLEKLSADELHARGFHRTEKGDTAGRIARRMGLSLKQLRELNPDVNFAQLRLGQILKLKAEEKK